MLLLLLNACDPGPGDGPFALAYSGGDDCVSADVSDLDPPDALTVELWMRGDPATSATPHLRPFVHWGGVFGLGEDEDENAFFWAGEEPGASTVSSLMDGVLHHVAGTWDGSTVTLFVDGEKQAFADGTMATAPTSKLRIGCDGDVHAYDGLLDEVRVSSVVRYDDDFELPTGAYAVDDDTIALFHFEEGEGEETLDAVDGRVASVYGPEWVAFSLGSE